MTKKCGIYKITNITNNKFYIGQSTDLSKRKSDHFYTLKNNCHCNFHLQSSYNKYGKKNFKFETLLYCESFELTRYEQYLVDCLRPEYNIRKECVDSPKRIFLSEEGKQKLSKLRKGIPRSEETKEKIRKSWETRSRVVSDETRQKMRDGQRNREKKFGYIRSEEATRKAVQTRDFNRAMREADREIELMLYYQNYNEEVESERNVKNI